jgi:hypothetical protein
MHNFTLALGAIIAITVMMVIPTTNFHVAKAYSCSSSTSTVHTPSASTSVSGNQGSCSTSSSSSSSTIHGFGAAKGPNNLVQLAGNNPGVSGSSSSGGSQSSCSISSASQHTIVVTSQSKPGRCP